MTIIQSGKFQTYLPEDEELRNTGVLFAKDDLGNDWYDLMKEIPEGNTTLHILPSPHALSKENYISQITNNPSVIFPFDGWIVSFNNEELKLLNSISLEPSTLVKHGWDLENNKLIVNQDSIRDLDNYNKKIKNRMLLELLSEIEILKELIEEEPDNENYIARLSIITRVRKDLYKLDTSNENIDWSVYQI